MNFSEIQHHISPLSVNLDSAEKKKIIFKKIK